METPTHVAPQLDASGDFEAPDAHGRAALLLVESLIHHLAVRSVISLAEAISIIEIALDAQVAIAEDAAQPTASMQKAAALLSSMMASLKIDLPDHDPERF